MPFVIDYLQHLPISLFRKCNWMFFYFLLSDYAVTAVCFQIILYGFNKLRSFLNCIFLKEVDLGEPSNYAPIIIGRLERINLDAMITDQLMYSQLRVQSLSVDEKWAGAPLAAMLRRHQSENADANDYILHVAVVLLPTSY
ncbi:hypothetical protein ACS0TY_018449 [Phlomoides rotata]